jgi:hypothetical protein
MDDLGAVAHRGSMGAMPISSTTFHNPMGGATLEGGGLSESTHPKNTGIYR